jgi:hypothetical protein
MKILFVSESGYNGFVNRNNNNIRTDVAWVCSLNAYHCNIFNLDKLNNNSFDYAIFIVPKLAVPSKNQKILPQITNYPIMDHLHRLSKKVCVMQEGTYWCWQDGDFKDQIWYYNLLINSDLIFCHNDYSLNYYKGLTDKPCEVLPTLMITDNIKTSNEKRNNVIIGGNFESIYRGFDSFIVARTFENDIYSISSGRRKDGEKTLGIINIPWINWIDWMYELSKFKYAVQLMCIGAGTFNMNCSYLGIPCIGMFDLNTQRILHPDLCINYGDIISARMLAERLKTDIDFYNECSSKTKILFDKYYKEEVFLEKMNKIFIKYL